MVGPNDAIKRKRPCRAVLRECQERVDRQEPVAVHPGSRVEASVVVANLKAVDPEAD
jgi:hypothetical protein